MVKRNFDLKWNIAGLKYKVCTGYTGGCVMVRESTFGTLSSGQEVRSYHLENSKGAFAEVISYGAHLVKLCVPDRNGVLRDVVLGYDSPAGYEANHFFFGATIGRNGNRIGHAEFMANGKKYTLAKNENDNNLHSGPNGFEAKIWDAAEIGQEENSVTFSRISPDGENGFPGEMKVAVKYTMTEDCELRIQYNAVCDQDSIANFTNHSYFNLAGEGSGDILSQELKINAQYYTPVDPVSIPVGIKAPVEGSVMDFRTAKPIGQDIEADFRQLLFTGGFDHNFVTDDYEEGRVRDIAEAYCKESGIRMTVSSDLPCVQFYAGNFIKDETGKNGHVYKKRNGFCLETQVEPDAVNVPDFHSPILKAGEKFQSVTGYRFSVD